MTVEVLLLVLLVASSAVGTGLGAALLLVASDLRFYRRLLEEARDHRDELIEDLTEESMSFEAALDDLQDQYDGLADAAVEAIGHLSGVDAAVGVLAAALDDSDDHECECCPNCCGCPVDEDEPAA